MAENNAPIRVGLLGAGTVVSQTARLLVEQKDELAQRIGRPVELSGVACLDPEEVDFPWIEKSLLTSDTMSVVKNADIVVELIGGTGVARTFVLEAMKNGASVVTANKALLAKISVVFAKNGFSINGVNQDLKPTLKDPGYEGEFQQLSLVRQMTDENTLRAPVAEVCELDCETGQPSILRVLD